MQSKFRLFISASMMLMTIACNDGTGEKETPASKTIPTAWKMLQIPQKNVTEVLPVSDENLLEVKLEKIEPTLLRKQIDQTLKKAGFKQVCAQFEDTVRGYKKSEERLVIKIDGGSDAWLWVLSGKSPKAAKDVFFGLCFKGYTAKKVYESKGSTVIKDELSQ